MGVAVGVGRGRDERGDLCADDDDLGQMDLLRADRAEHVVQLVDDGQQTLHGNSQASFAQGAPCSAKSLFASTVCFRKKNKFDTNFQNITISQLER